MLKQEEQTKGVKNVAPDALSAIQALYQNKHITAEERDGFVRMVKDGMKDGSAYSPFLVELYRMQQQIDNTYICELLGRVITKIKNEITQTEPNTLKENENEQIQSFGFV